MTVRYHCDGPDCDKQMAVDEPRLALVVEGPEDVEEDDEGFITLPALELSFDGDFHFCSDTCLTAWAMARALDNGDST